MVIRRESSDELFFKLHNKVKSNPGLPLFYSAYENELPMPWFGLDIGGTLTKLVYFEPCQTNLLLDSEEDMQREKNIRHYLLSNSAYGEQGIRDEHLQLDSVSINGRIGSVHFIRFPTERMMKFIQLVKQKGFTQVSSTVCATGGGAVKYAAETEKELNMSLHKSDELHSLIKGIELIAANNPDECFYYDRPLEGETKVVWRWNRARCSTQDHQFAGQEPMEEGLQYPYVLCNIGSGVSVMVVKGRNEFERVTGSSIGGGFFHGLCALLCNAESFEEAIELASKGDNRRVDKLVGDIYGTSYDNIGLPSDTVAASFGKVCSQQASQTDRCDLARSALVTVANNIGAIALNVATQFDVERVVFVGNFLRVNPLAARLLAYAMEFWSKGAKRALFLNHEGYFGAVGCLDRLVEVTQSRNVLKLRI